MRGEGGATPLGIAFGLASPVIARGGNLVAVRNQRDGLPLLPSTAWGMAYGALAVAVVAGAAGAPWTFDPRAPYVLSLALPRRVRQHRRVRRLPDAAQARRRRAVGFVGVATPVVAMLLSTLFEGYRWTWIGAMGVVLAAIGNVIALRPAGQGPGTADTRR